MPFINIKILEGHSLERKRDIVNRVTAVVAEVAQVPKDKIWVVIEDVKQDNWSVDGKLLIDG